MLTAAEKRAREAKRLMLEPPAERSRRLARSLLGLIFDKRTPEHQKRKLIETFESVIMARARHVTR